MLLAIQVPLFLDRQLVFVNCKVNFHIFVYSEAVFFFFFPEMKLSSKGARTPCCRPWRVLTQTRAQTNTFLKPRSSPVVFFPEYTDEALSMPAVRLKTTSQSLTSLLELLAGDKRWEIYNDGFQEYEDLFSAKSQLLYVVVANYNKLKRIFKCYFFPYILVCIGASQLKGTRPDL